MLLLQRKFCFIRVRPTLHVSVVCADDVRDQFQAGLYTTFSLVPSLRLSMLQAVAEGALFTVHECERIQK